ncbi:SIR2 family protein [Rhodococcus qingshengii]|uniref:SIR2 family protein n=1 Tax=Rhodococcus qingshengii TaxID=334542 RepID=UPI0039C414A7
MSTETPAVFPTTFYEKIQEELGQTDGTLSFPDLMQEFEERFGRTKLVGNLKKRLDYVDSFQSLRFEARKFHRELATMPYLEEIVTTNWDTYFERECFAAPYVTGEDFAFIGVPGRKVYKMHGSIGSLSSLVITENDYTESIDRLSNNLLGSTIKNLLANKTVVFIGYSLSDWNFQRIYKALRSDMGKFWRPAFVVTPFSPTATEGDSLIHIKTSGQKFLQTLKLEMTGHCFLSDELYEKIEDLQALVIEANEISTQYKASSHPTIVHCWAYQEGLRDVCARILDLRPSGVYSDRNHVSSLAHTYFTYINQALDEGKYFTAAYMEGYLNGLMVVLDDGDEIFELTPLHHIYGSDSLMQSQQDLEEALQHSRRRAPKARSEAKRIALNIPDGMIVQHGPMLKISPRIEPKSETAV